MIKEREKRIVIIGGGPAGIGAGWRLKELGYKNWELYEKESFLGGLSASFKDKKGFVWDNGGHIYFSKNDYFNKVFRKLMGRDFFKKERFQYIWWGDKPIPYPFQNNIRHLPPNVLFECLKDLKETKKIKPKNFLEFNLVSFGDGITKHFMQPYNEKIWAHPLRGMAFNWVTDRVSRIDFNKALENVILGKDEANWGPNFHFNYPIRNGAGDFWSRFYPKFKDNIKFNSEIKKVNFKNKKIYFRNSKEENYDYLISALPIDFLIHNSDAPKEAKKAAKNLVYNSGLILGLGIKGKQPESLKNKVAFYFPQKELLFQRMLIFKSFSPYNAPKNHWSLIFEASFSKYKPLTKEKLIKNAVNFVKNHKWIKSDKSIISTFIKEFKYFYPVPTIDRDKNLDKIQNILVKNNVYSIGRFGAWKYEVGNMDNSFMMGVEAVNKILN